MDFDYYVDFFYTTLLGLVVNRGVCHYLVKPEKQKRFRAKELIIKWG